MIIRSSQDDPVLPTFSADRRLFLITGVLKSTTRKNMKMYSFNATTLSVILFTLILGIGCSPDQVNPRDPFASRPAISAGNEEAHPVFEPNCSDSILAQLSDGNGNFNVDYCKSWPFRPCPANPSLYGKWGNVEVINGWDSISIRVNLGTGWFIDTVAAYVGGGSSTLPFPPGSTPPAVGNSGWVYAVPATDFNSKTFFFDKRDIWKDPNGCFLNAVRISIFKISGLNPAVDPLSRRRVWMNSTGLSGLTFQLDANGQIINTTNADVSQYITSNPYILNWCWKRNCRTQPMGGIYLTNSCSSIPSYTIPTSCDTIFGHGCNYGSGPGTINAINNEVRCIDTTAAMGTFNFSTSNGTLRIKSGNTVTAGINAYYGCTLIVEGTLNWVNTATYNGNMQIYVAPGGRINRAGTTGSLTLNHISSRIINEGEIDIDANLISRGAVYNKGTLTSRNITLTGGNGILVNKRDVVVEQNLTINCGSPSTCSANSDNLQNCGSIRVNTAISAAAGTNTRNYCTMASNGSYTQGGNFWNQGVVVAGLTGIGNGFVNTGNTVFQHTSVVLTRNFNWGARSIRLDSANAWIVSGDFTLNPSSSSYFIQSITGVGRFNIPSTATMTGVGALNVVDADNFTTGDIPSTSTGIKTLLTPSGLSRLQVFTRGVAIQDDSLETCIY
jgi:hypothetical protein